MSKDSLTPLFELLEELDRALQGDDDEAVEETVAKINRAIDDYNPGDPIAGYEVIRPGPILVK